MNNFTGAKKEGNLMLEVFWKKEENIDDGAVRNQVCSAGNFGIKSKN